jgi:hypothetical protein
VHPDQVLKRSRRRKSILPRRSYIEAQRGKTRQLIRAGTARARPEKSAKTAQRDEVIITVVRPIVQAHPELEGHWHVLAGVALGPINKQLKAQGQVKKGVKQDSVARRLEKLRSRLTPSSED